MKSNSLLVSRSPVTPVHLHIISWEIMIPVCLEPIIHLLLELDSRLMKTIDGLQKFNHKPNRTLVPCR